MALPPKVPDNFCAQYALVQMRNNIKDSFWFMTKAPMRRDPTLDISFVDQFIPILRCIEYSFCNYFYCWENPIQWDQIWQKHWRLLAIFRGSGKILNLLCRIFMLSGKCSLLYLYAQILNKKYWHLVSLVSIRKLLICVVILNYRIIIG